MSGISPKLPLSISPEDGYALNKTLKQSIKQNFKMLMLTNPGERMMDPTFGVGLKRYLFENNHQQIREQIKQRIINQTRKSLPFIRIENISINSSDSNPELYANSIHISISYSILPLRETVVFSTVL